MANYYNLTWENLPHELLAVIGHKLGSLENYMRFSAVCKSWRSAVSKMRQDDKPFLPPPEYPLLFLAEKLPEGAILGCDIEDDQDEDGYEEDDDEEGAENEEEDNGDEGEDSEEDNEDEDMHGEDEYEYGVEDEELEGDEYFEDQDGEDNGDEAMAEDIEEENGEESNDEDEDLEGQDEYGHEEEEKIGDVDFYEVEERDIYSLSKRKTYTIKLPEAAGKLILGTNKGWLLTLGIDFKINLLHPLLRQQISLPPMHTFPIPHQSNSREEVFDVFLRKVAMSSEVQQKKNGVVDNDTPDPIIMTIYGGCGFLGFTKLGGEVWTNVDTPSGCFEDIAYFRGNFYAVDCHGGIFVCDIDDDYKGTKISECPLQSNGDFDQRYLVESGSDLWLLVRIRQLKHFKPPHERRVKYRTTHFSVWKLEQENFEDGLETPCTWIPKNNLGDKAFFIGRNTSVSLPSSVYIRPNCIYFTDDAWDLYYPDGGGHDMGIFDMESHTIEPHFEGKSIHGVSPPFWYI